ncbi:acyl-CoA dehydrogenase family protein [Arthrobacter jiangjiafuii]|uniref:Acyl-CoA dehydrogenase family protein n=1 Tax=Arthrobacter jiangjiafuii TaxID=2817475 RepID=A0A975M4N6_9MICC|nr:acyl-CoA dehydrogenase family protein [Arthrobacter jiangjiafuii]MBP3042442.1 acyl-CoA dehydrogenase family protein [Arthrobacter jiangjiafuii]QWC09810.1 acyl-CoA dehydrogenase family protein [Arthrobacter jiangjiafuii]
MSTKDLQQAADSAENDGAREVREREVTASDARALAEASRIAEDQRPSFAKGIYMGSYNLDLIRPHQRDPEEDIRARGFLDQLTAYCATLDGELIERTGAIPDEYLRGLAELGVFGMKIPRKYSGLGLSLLSYGRALMVLSSVHPSLGALTSAHLSIGVPEPVKVFGTEEQKEEYLPRCAGGAISAFLLTEPDVGSDPARMRATAVPSEDGSEYVLDGVKLWTTNGVIAELVVVMAAVPPHGTEKGGVSAFVVEMDIPGITVENRNNFMGLRGIENGVTRLRGVRVPSANRLGREGQGLKIALTTLNTGRLSIPAMCAASGKWSLKIARGWTGAREQWGRPIWQHEAVGKKVAFIAATAFAVESVFELSAEMADAGTKDIRIEAALAKLWASEMAFRIGDELVQIRGGRGFETASSLAARGERAVAAEQQLRDLRINRVFEGSTEIMHLLIARDAVDAHLKAAGDLAVAGSSLSSKVQSAVKASGFYGRWLPTLAAGRGSVPTAYAEFGPLSGHLRYADRASRRLARSTFYGMARWQAGLEHHQVFLGRIVDIGAELFAMSAVCMRAETMRGKDPQEGAAAYELAGAFCAQSRVRIDTLFDDLWRNSDAEDRRLAKGVLGDRYTWLEAGVLDQSEGTGPWISETANGTVAGENLHRRYR